VVLFDEIEKAHTEVFDVLLRFADEGLISDPAGPVRDGRKCIIVMTTNAGQRWMRDHFVTHPEARNDQRDTLAKQLFDAAREELQQAGFRPEFLGRVDERISFLPFTLETCQKIVDGVVKREMEKFLKLKGVTIEVTEKARNILARFAYDRSTDEGARGAPRAVNDFLVTPAIDLLSNYNVDSPDAPSHLITAIEGIDRITLEVCE
jgi:ATP-dependent Clp protease ATP-binding subunit ClpA